MSEQLTDVKLTLILSHKPECSLLQPVRSTNTEQKSCDCGYEDNLAYVEYQNITIKRLTSQLDNLTADLDTSEAACADLMTLNDKLTGEVDRLRRLISEAIEAINPNIIDNLLFEAINPHQYALLQPDALKGTK